MQIKRISDNMRALFFLLPNWNKESEEKKIYRWTKFFFTSWTITSESAHGRTCKKTKVYIYLYISLYENLFEKGCINIYILYESYSFSFSSSTSKVTPRTRVNDISTVSSFLEINFLSRNVPISSCNFWILVNSSFCSVSLLRILMFNFLLKSSIFTITDKSCKLLSGIQELKSSLYPNHFARACFFL